MADRLQKVIAESGLMSRRAAEEAIRDGRVSLNGRTARLGDTASTSKTRKRFRRIRNERIKDKDIAYADTCRRYVYNGDTVLDRHLYPHVRTLCPV